jgi:hypothetical protein
VCFAEDAHAVRVGSVADYWILSARRRLLFLAQALSCGYAISIPLPPNPPPSDLNPDEMTAAIRLLRVQARKLCDGLEDVREAGRRVADRAWPQPSSARRRGFRSSKTLSSMSPSSSRLSAYALDEEFPSLRPPNSERTGEVAFAKAFKEFDEAYCEFCRSLYVLFLL